MGKSVNSSAGMMFLVTLLVGFLYFMGNALAEQDQAWGAMAESIDATMYQLSQ